MRAHRRADWKMEIVLFYNKMERGCWTKKEEHVEALDQRCTIKKIKIFTPHQKTKHKSTVLCRQLGFFLNLIINLSSCNLINHLFLQISFLNLSTKMQRTTSVLIDGVHRVLLFQLGAPHRRTISLVKGTAEEPCWNA